MYKIPAKTIISLTDDILGIEKTDWYAVREIIERHVENARKEIQKIALTAALETA